MRDDELKQLREQRQQLIVELRSFSDAMTERARENDGDILAEDQEELDKREKDLIKVNRMLETHNRTQALVAFDPNAKAEWLPQDGKPTTLAEYRSHHMAVRAIDEPDVRQAVYSWIIKGREGIDLEEYRVLSKAASGGGFLVPTDLAQEIVRALRFLPGGVGSLARTIVTSSGDTFNVPLNLTHGTAAWVAESGSYTPSDETMTQAALSAYKAGTKIIVSEELLTDSAFDLSGFLSAEFGERIGALAEDAYVNGDGTGKPTGILAAGSAVTVSTLPAGQVTTTTIDALMAAIYTVPVQYRTNMSLLASDGLWVRIATLKDSTGRLIWSPSTADGVPDRLQGIPIYAHPGLPAIGASSKSMIAGDFGKAYWIRRVDGIYMQRQNELHSDSGQVGFRAYLRLDGKVVLADALRVVAFAAT